MSAPALTDTSLRLARLARFAVDPTAPPVGEFEAHDDGLEQVLRACPPSVQAEVAEAADLPAPARVARAVEWWLGAA